jgi:putative NIF3 family GTP cyclohydrolase 1 type 2
LCAAGIGVYSPHTSLDSAVGGINDWLANVVIVGAKSEVSPIIPCIGVEGLQYDGETNCRPRERRTWTGCETTFRDSFGYIDQTNKVRFKLEIWYHDTIIRC